MKRAALFFTLVSVLFACQDDRNLTEPQPEDLIAPPQYAILDGLRGGNAFFFWLPVLKHGWQPPTDFNPRLSPTLTICESMVEPWTTDDPCTGRKAVFTKTEGPGSTIRVITRLFPRYQLIWKTSSSGFPAFSGNWYRAHVSVGDQELGFIDLKAASTLTQAARITKDALSDSDPTNDVIGFVAGYPVPLLFGIYEGALCWPSCDADAVSSGDVFEGTFASTGNPEDVFTFTTPNEDVGFSFGGDAFTGTVNFFIERLRETNPHCLGTDLPQFEACFRIRTDVQSNEDVDVTVGGCVDPAAIEDDDLQIHRQSEDADGQRTGPVVALESTGAEFLDCTGFSAGLVGESPLGRLASAGLKFLQPLTQLAAPKLLLAKDLGLGGLTKLCCSRFGWAKALSVGIVAGDDQTVPLGGTVEVEVRVSSTHTGSPVSGIMVNFAPGFGTVSAPTAVTDANGLASTNWTLDVAGTHRLRASIPGDAFVEFALTAVGPTTTALVSPVPLAVVGSTVPLEATVIPAPPQGSTVEFFEGTTSLGTAVTDATGKASRSVTLSFSLSRQFFTARFVGTASHGASTSSTVVQDKWQAFSDLASFTAALGGTPTETQNFNGVAVGTPITTIIPGVLGVTSPFPNLEVFTCGGTVNCLFGSGGTVRQDGDGRYDMQFLASRNALAFDLVDQDPNTGTATVQIITAVAGLAIGERNSNSETTPNFFGIILTLPIQSASVIEGAEVGGVGNEEIALDNFVVASVPVTIS